MEGFFFPSCIFGVYYTNCNEEIHTLTNCTAMIHVVVVSESKYGIYLFITGVYYFVDVAFNSISACSGLQMNFPPNPDAIICFLGILWSLLYAWNTS